MMKYVVLTTVVVSLALGFVPQSFRMQSTAGVWEDDYDLIFDPARLTEIEGSRVYTNLANYVNGNEQQFNPSASNFFLIGGSLKFGKNAFPGLVFDRYGFKRPEFTRLYDPLTGDSLFGSAEVDSVAWLDLDTNGTYDAKHVERDARSAWRSGSDDDVFVGVGFLGKKSRFGIAFAYNDSCRTGPSGSGGDASFYSYDSSLFAGRLTYLDYDTQFAAARTNASRASIVLSGRFDLKGGAVVGVNLQPALLGGSEVSYADHSTYLDFAPGNSPVSDYVRASRFDTLKFPYQGLEVPLSVQWVKTDAGRSEMRLTLTGFIAAQSLGAGAGRNYVLFGEQTLNPGLSSGWDSVVRRDCGASSSRGVTASLLNLNWIGPRFNLGWGLRFGAAMSSDSLLDSSATKSIWHYDDGDSLQTADDYVSTSTSGESWLLRTAASRVSLAVPVGLEFRVIPSIALRLGAIHTFLWDDRIDTKQLKSLSPTWFRTDYGDGTFSEVWDSPQIQPAVSETRNTFSQTTTFTYGAGFMPVENLQIDLMGFANLTNLANWRLSATFRF
jgi:hypothetical protein